MNFHGFTPDSFEQLIRALSLKIFGPGVTVFGNGPDGGREATFKGIVPYPFPSTDVWSGYGVIQAKFKEKLEGTKRDQTWAAQQLIAELKQWKKSTKRKPKPDYFIYCINVELSSAKNGGREKLEEIFKLHTPKLGLKGFAIWDANQLIGYVNSNSGIRNRFRTLFTPGDLLAQLADTLAKVPNSEAILYSYLCRELSADEDAKLSQAGDRSEDRIRLAKVFVDLPSSSKRGTEAEEELDEEEDERPGSLDLLLHSAARKLDPLALHEQNERADRDIRENSLYARFVFLGGPGSGKSTLGQFLAQIHRSALLDRRSQHRLEPKVKEIIREVKQRCHEEGAKWPVTPRYPFRIDLNAFAKALARQGSQISTLSQYLRANLSQDCPISHDDLRDWLSAFPSLLILDGLDEVPSSSNRREVVSAIQSFLNEAREAEADLMVVASSRPDGYANEFADDEVAHRYLIPMSKERALGCAQRYVDAKITSTGEQRAREAMVILTTAINNPLIAKLMRSPLQVTFMVTVVAASGKPSDSRWQLFNDYYRIIYERELHKAVRPFDKVLNERRQDIDALHQKVGFILQGRAELSGNTQADLSNIEFEGMVSKCLSENGLDTDELETEMQMILGAANLRLVFLTSRTPGRLSFDVRSLQEYMAAACMTNTDINKIIRTLEIISYSNYWRNTLLFAIGRFFVEPQLRDHRNKIRLLCDDLNRREGIAPSVKAGSFLALEILESGTVGNVPLIARSLADCSLDLLGMAISGGEISRRFAHVYSPPMEAEYKLNINIWLGQAEPEKTYLAWMLVLHLRKKDVEWAALLAAQQWPNSIELAWNLLTRWINEHEFYEFSETLGYSLDVAETAIAEYLVPRVEPYRISEFGGSIKIHDSNPDAIWIQRASEWIFGTSNLFMSELRLAGVLSNYFLWFVGLPTERERDFFSAISDISSYEEVANGWKLLNIFSEFYLAPSAETLARSIETVFELEDPYSVQIYINRLSWPLQCCLKAAWANNNFTSVVAEIRRGDFGDILTWRNYEEALQNFGVNIEDLPTPIFQACPILTDGITRITPGATDYSNASDVTVGMFEVFMQAESPFTRSNLAWMIVFFAKMTSTLQSLSPTKILNDLLCAREDWDGQMLLAGNEFVSITSTDWYELFDAYGNLPDLQFGRFGWRLEKTDFRFYQNAYSDNPARKGILRLAAHICARGGIISWTFTESLSISTDVSQNLFYEILIRIADPKLKDVDADFLAECVPDILARQLDPICADLIVAALESHARRNPLLVRVLTQVILHLPFHRTDLGQRCANLQRRISASTPSGFSERVLSDLGLPSIGGSFENSSGEY